MVCVLNIHITNELEGGGPMMNKPAIHVWPSGLLWLNGFTANVTCMNAMETTALLMVFSEGTIWL